MSQAIDCDSQAVAGANPIDLRDFQPVSHVSCIDPYLSFHLSYVPQQIGFVELHLLSRYVCYNSGHNEAHTEYIWFIFS